jgi:WD40 repeat protein
MADAGTGEKLKVFISYSRRDSAAFADELMAGLEYGRFAPFLDRHDIVPGEPWEARLGGQIAHSDTVVFVVSPEAVKSDRCAWEVDRTIELSKRLLPVIFKPVPEHDIPKKLSQLQFVRFDTGRGVTRPLAELAEALRGGALSTQLHRQLKGHSKAVGSAAFSGDGKRVVTASDDGTARIWDAESGREIAVLKGHALLMSSGAFSGDGKRLVTAAWDNTCANAFVPRN